MHGVESILFQWISEGHGYSAAARAAPCRQQHHDWTIVFVKAKSHRSLFTQELTILESFCAERYFSIEFAG
jgi:hypothetical protein